MPRTSPQKKPQNEPRIPRSGPHDDMTSLNTFSGQQVILLLISTTPTDPVLAERHGAESSRREHTPSSVNYNGPAAPFCTRLALRTTAPPVSNNPRKAQRQQPALFRTPHTPHTPPTSSSPDAHSANGEASLPSGSYFSTVLSPSASPRQKDRDSPPAMQNSTENEHTGSEERSSSPIGSAPTKRKSTMPM